MQDSHKAKWMAVVRLSLSYFSKQSSERYFARAGLIAIFIASFAQIQIMVLLNIFHGNIFTALQSLNIHNFFYSFATLVIGNLLFIGLLIGRTYFQQIFELRWRRWLTAKYLEKWTMDAAFYRMRFQHEDGIDNPDQRVAEDIKNLISGTLSIVSGFFGSFVSLFSFGAVLWALSGSIEIPLWYDFKTQTISSSLSVQGYLVWIAIFYEFVTTFIAFKIGRSLTGLDNQQQRREADFRYGLVHLREEAESIALLRGAALDRTYMINKFSEIYKNGMRLIVINARYTSFQYFSGQLTSYLPYLVAGPRYFTGAITLGQFVQINGALLGVTDSLGWLLGSFPSLASWRATVDRLLEFEAALEACEAFNSTFIIKPDSEALSLDADVSLSRPDGSLLLTAAAGVFKIGPGEHTSVTGISGDGKSTLMRALAGLWPYGEGVINTPDASISLFLPQKPYFPLGVSLRQALWYPQAAPSASDLSDEESQLLYDLDLHHLIAILDSGASADWCKILSLGEQQRLALIRACLSKPKWLFMDEPFSALDQDNQRRAARLLNEKLSGTTIIYAGHAPPFGLNIKRHFILSQQSLKPAPISAPIEAGIEMAVHCPNLRP